jgi:hypothetical protein
MGHIKAPKNLTEMIADFSAVYAAARNHEIPVKEYIEHTNAVGKFRGLIQTKMQEKARLKINEEVPEAQ